MKIAINAGIVKEKDWNFFLRGSPEKPENDEISKPDFIDEKIWTNILNLCLLSEDYHCILESFVDHIDIWH